MGRYRHFIDYMSRYMLRIYLSIQLVCCCMTRLERKVTNTIFQGTSAKRCQQRRPEVTKNMPQISLTTSGAELATERTRKRAFLDEISLFMPYSDLVGLIELFALMCTGAKGGLQSVPLRQCCVSTSCSSGLVCPI